MYKKVVTMFTLNSSLQASSPTEQAEDPRKHALNPEQASLKIYLGTRVEPPVVLFFT